MLNYDDCIIEVVLYWGAAAEVAVVTVYCVRPPTPFGIWNLEIVYALTNCHLYTFHNCDKSRASSCIVFLL